MYINPENQSPVFVIHNSTPLEDRQRIIEKYKSKTIAGTHQSGSEGKNKQTTDTKRRDSGVHFVADDIDLTMHVFNLIRIANHMAGYDYKLSGFEAVQFTRYAKKQHYDYHIDSDAHMGRLFAFQLPKERELAFTNHPDLINTIRKMSCSVILNDDYEGGEFCTKTIQDGQVVEHTIPAVAGDTLVFPSYINHCVKPVKKGVRYSLVQWAAGPAFI